MLQLNYPLCVDTNIIDPIKQMLGQSSSHELIARGINECVNVRVLQQINDRLVQTLHQMQ